MKKTIVMGWALLAVLWWPAWGQAQERQGDAVRAGRLTVGTNLGLAAGTPDGAAFALLFQGDYYLDNHFSLGPMIQFGISDDLFQIGISGQAKYVFVNPRFPQVRPHLQGGLGFVAVDSDRPGFPTKDDDDLGFLVPFGGGVEVVLARNVYVGSTLLLNFTDVDVKGKSGNTFMVWVFGLRLAL